MSSPVRPITIQTALRHASRLLEDAAVEAPRLTAEVLLSHILSREREYLYGHFEEELSEEARLHYECCLQERLTGKPTQYIIGHQEFYGREFLVTPDVLIPRPETEHLVEVALEVASPTAAVLDVGCGSGAIAVSLALEMGRCVLASDISMAALQVAARNAKRLGAQVHFAVSDLTSAFAPASVDLLVSNPPYVPVEEGPGLQREIREHEPAIALFGGPAGLDVYRRLAKDAPRVLRAGGWLAVELDFRAAQPVAEMLGSQWTDIRVEHDLAGFPRVLAARLRS